LYIDSKLLFFRTLTPVHIGAGRGTKEHVDLPIQRDEFDFPTIWSSSLKGGFRGSYTRLTARTKNSNDEKMMEIVFGPSPERGYEFSSSINFLDARLLFIPVRSLRKIWTYVTSPHLINYLITYLIGLNRESYVDKILKLLNETKIPTVSRKDLFVKNNSLVLNEIEVKGCTVNQELTNIFKQVLPKEIVDNLSRRGIVLVDDDLVFELVRRSLVIQFRIRIKHEVKVVESGSLWSEEYIPQGTIFVSGIICKPHMNVNGHVEVSGKEVLDWFKNKLSSFNYTIWLGGKETIGKGLLKVYLHD